MPARALSTTATALTIAGSDSGGGAGIQADLKAFARCGVHGASAITAITAQNTLGVSAIHQLPVEIVLAQVRAVLADIRVDAVKIGMVGSAEVTLALAGVLDELAPGTPVVLDPVMVAESGARLLDADAQLALVQELVPRASVITPNLPEARALLAGRALDVEEADRRDEHDEALELARALLALGPRAVVVTGGHRTRAVDVFIDAHAPEQPVAIDGERHPDGAAHGSGCTHASVLAALLALGHSPLEAARGARRLAGEAVAHGLRDVGAGPGPVDVLDLTHMRGARSDG
jgi:hydroxymethylpyrimidine/phosphomethylpyrimidine kinase